MVQGWCRLTTGRDGLVRTDFDKLGYYGGEWGYVIAASCATDQLVLELRVKAMGPNDFLFFYDGTDFDAPFLDR